MCKMKKLLGSIVSDWSRLQRQTYATSFVTPDIPVLPSTDHIARKYQGLDYDTVQRIKEAHVVPCIKSLNSKPLLINEAHMQWLYDHTGKRYLDMFAGIVTVSVGHCHPRVTEAAKSQLDKLIHCSNLFQHSAMYEYTRKLVKTLPPHLNVIYLVNSGSEANELAILLARLYTKKQDVIAFNSAYHGGTHLTQTLTALATYKYPRNNAPGIHHALMPDVYRGIWGGARCRYSPIQTKRYCECPPNQCDATNKSYEQLVNAFQYNVPITGAAALIAESIQGVAGVKEFPRYFLRKAYEMIKSTDGLFISDEVQTGFGRTGDNFWGFEMHGVSPDIVTMAKGIANGFPMGAVATTTEIAQVLTKASHFNTFGGNPVSCAAASAVLDVIKDEELQSNCKEVGNYLLTQLAKLRDQFEIVGDVRGKGLMIGVDLVQNKETRVPLNSRHMSHILDSCKDIGLILGRGGLSGNVIRIKPPMCVTMEDAKFTFDVLHYVLTKFQNKKL
uniref:Alanine--glyoxylate aminotransferase 2, mitochondrial n=3 Tax=Cacopsylla melanoneura TaxID=428564 RepID=A0A8D8ZQ11_9HEMI